MRVWESAILRACGSPKGSCGGRSRAVPPALCAGRRWACPLLRRPCPLSRRPCPLSRRPCPLLRGLPALAAALPTLTADLPTLAAALPTLAADLPTLTADPPTLTADLPTLAADLPTLAAAPPALAAAFAWPGVACAVERRSPYCRPAACDWLMSGCESVSCRWNSLRFTSGQNSFITCEKASVASATQSLSTLSETSRVSG